MNSQVNDISLEKVLLVDGKWSWRQTVRRKSSRKGFPESVPRKGFPERVPKGPNTKYHPIQYLL